MVVVVTSTVCVEENTAVLTVVEVVLRVIVVLNDSVTEAEYATVDVVDRSLV